MPLSRFFKELRKHPVAKILMLLLACIAFLGIYAPLFASSQPLAINYLGKWYFPFFKTLFFPGLYTKKIDLFFNLLMFTLPFFLFFKIWIKKYRAPFLVLCILFQCTAFYYTSENYVWKYLQSHTTKDPFLFQSKLSETDVKFCLKPLLVSYHWQDEALDATSYFSQTRLNGQNLWASLLFGIRYSLTIALSSTLLAFLIGIFFGALAGYCGKTIDLVVGRLIEVWESIPVLFVLLLILAKKNHPSIIWIIMALALFSWTAIAKIVRIEVIKQKSLPYVDVLRGFGYHPLKIVVRHILISSIPTLLTLFPFAMLGAITYESALSFLGFGDRQSCSLGLLLDESRMVYPMMPQLFWPPAILVMVILICLVWLGDVAKKILSHRESLI